MLDLILNFRFTKGLPLYHFQDKNEPLPSSFAMAWCMLATSVSRIFTKEDMREFLFRLAITLHSLDLVENWLMKDGLMSYSVKGKQYVLQVAKSCGCDFSNWSAWIRPGFVLIEGGDQ